MSVRPEREPDFYWSGRPVYRCRVCADRFARVDRLDVVLEHEAAVHGPRERTSSTILAADGKPAKVETRQ